MQAKTLRSKQHGDHDDWVRRVEDLEAHVLSAKLVPVASGKDAMPPPMPVPNDLVPNGLLQEFKDRTTAEEVYMDKTPEEEEEEKEQQELTMKSLELGLPSLYQLGLPKGAKIIDIRLVEPNVCQQQWKVDRRRLARPPPPQQPTLKGRIMDSNWALTPSPYHPVGPAAQMGLLQNLYPVDRCPVNLENVFQSTWPGAEEKWYQAYADSGQSRAFPALYPEATFERDVDKGGRIVRNVQWRSAPAGENMAAIGVDVDGDGFADITVVGKDLNYDGVPDILEVPAWQRLAQGACSRIFPY